MWRRFLIWTVRVGLILGVLAIGFCLFAPNVHLGAGPFWKAALDAQMVGFYCQRYARTHDGRLPPKIEDLVSPENFPNKGAVDRTWLMTPGALLRELPKTSIIAIKIGFDPGQRGFRLFLIHADMNVEEVKP